MLIVLFPFCIIIIIFIFFLHFFFCFLFFLCLFGFIVFLYSTDLQNTTRQNKDLTTRIPLKTRMLKWLAVPASLVTPVVLLLHD